MTALPIDKLREPFDTALEQGHVVVAAATGSGKSTRLPLWARHQGRVLVVEPRRLACTALATYLAGQDGSAPGEEIGYAIRFDSRCSRDTGLIFATPGVALRWLGEDGLAGFDTVMLDEFHERRQDTDLLLGLLARGRRHRLVVTSATLAASSLGRWLDAAVLECDGQGHPVEAHHLESDARAMPTLRNLESRVTEAVHMALARSDGDVLVFLPGRGEIRAAARALEGLEAEVLTLHASSPAARQQQALAPGSRRRVILATNVAETSLTIPGITAVVDSGLERRTGHRNGRTVLTLAAISASSARQRAGRAGRTAPGICLRLWGRAAPLQEFTPPEMQREQVADTMLAAAAAGEALEALPLPDPPPEKALVQARARLQAMGAVDDRDRITAHGRRLFALPIDPLFAHLVSAMPDDASRGAMADLAAALSGTVSLVSLPRDEEGRRALQQWQPVPCDATTLIAALRSRPPATLHASQRARQEARRLATRIRGALDLPPPPEQPDFDREALLRAVVRAAPELAFVRREKRRHALGNGESELQVDRASRFDEEHEAALVFDDHSVPAGRGTRQNLTLGTCMAPVPLKWLAGEGIGEERQARIRWEEDQLVAVMERHHAGRVIATRETEPEGELLREALAELILRSELLVPAGDRLVEELRQWRLWVALGHNEGEEDEGEVPDARDWLVRRLATLGVDAASDVALLEPEDLRFQGIPVTERERFDERYPARLNLGDLILAVHYDTGRRQVTVERIGGRRRKDPARWELPAWKGWKIQYRRGSRVVDIH